jgi:hypothetical protein
MRGIDRDEGGGGGGGGFSMGGWCPARVARRKGLVAALAERAASPHPRAVSERWSRLTGRTFRWNDGVSTEGYRAAEVQGDEVVWFEWSHVHGRGRTEVARQRLVDLERAGAPFAVPAHVLAEIVHALGGQAPGGQAPGGQAPGGQALGGGVDGGAGSR